MPPKIPLSANGFRKTMSKVTFKTTVLLGPEDLQLSISTRLILSSSKPMGTYKNGSVTAKYTRAKDKITVTGLATATGTRDFYIKQLTATDLQLFYTTLSFGELPLRNTIDL